MIQGDNKTCMYIADGTFLFKNKMIYLSTVSLPSVH